MATQRKTRSSTAAQSKQANGVSSSAGKVSSSKAAGGSKVAASKDDDSVFHEYEFGGPIGTLAMMIVFPALFYYFYVCLYFHDGKMFGPDDALSPQSWLEFAKHVYFTSVEHAAPNMRSATLYFSFLAIQLVLAFTMPGVKQVGLPVAGLGGRTLEYHCNALASFYVTILVVAGAHFSGLVHLGELIDLYGPLYTTASMTGFGLAAIFYLTGEQYRMSGNVIYDYFMGSSLNPRIGIVDIKMWAEIRISWMLLWLLALGAAARQYEQHGFVSANAILFIYGTLLYLNATCKAEELIPQTWDMNFEKFGWLLSYWNFAGVPFSYAYPAIYIATHDPSTYRYPTPVMIGFFVTLTVAYCIFDVAMGQKSVFKAQQTGTLIPRNAFPAVPGKYIENPKVMETPHGKLLLDGWWAVLRKPNYTSDNIQAWIWGLSAGTNSVIPYWYPFFHAVMLLHRSHRDDQKCARKYGKYWDEYCKQVPYKFIPYIY